MLKETLRAYTILGLAIFGVMGLAFAEDNTNVITNTTTTTSTVNSNNSNTNVNQSTNNNTNLNTNNTTINQTTNSTSTNNNTSVNTNTNTNNSTNNSTSDVTSNITQSVTSNINQSTDNTSLNTNNNTNVSTSSSSSSVETKNENINSSVNNNNNNNVNNNNSNSRQVVTQRIKGQINSAIAPSINSYSQLVCTSGTSTSVQTNLFGIASGRSVIDLNCQRVLLSRELASQGMRVASVSLLCQDKRVFKAMMMAGTPCPINGLIGDEARAYWISNPEIRPDWEDIKKEYKDLNAKVYKKKDFCRKFKSHKLCLD